MSLAMVGLDAFWLPFVLASSLEVQGQNRRFGLQDSGRYQNYGQLVCALTFVKHLKYAPFMYVADSAVGVGLS